MPVFLPTIPQPTDQLSVSQGNILNNFTVLGSIAGNTNPSSSSINANSGFNWLFLPTQAGAIPPTGSAFPAGTIGVYSATDPITTKNELYVNKTNQATVVQIPMTGSILSTVSNPGTSSPGWTYLPSGVLLMWNTVSAQTGGSSSGNARINIPSGAGYPTFSIVFQIILQQKSSSLTSANAYSVVPGSVSSSSFAVSWSGNVPAGSFLNFLIIGIPVAY